MLTSSVPIALLITRWLNTASAINMTSKSYTFQFILLSIGYCQTKMEISLYSTDRHFIFIQIVFKGRSATHNRSLLCCLWCLWINLKKTKVYIHLSTWCVPYKEPTIFVKNTRLEVVNTFPYLGSTISKGSALAAKICFTYSVGKCCIWEIGK